MPEETVRYGVYIPLGYKLLDKFNSSSSHILRLGIVEVKNGEKISNPDLDHPFKDLVFHAYLSWYDGEWSVSMFYAEYHDIYTVDLAKAERLFKALSRISKIESKFPVRPETFGQYVALVCMGLGIKHVVRQMEKNGSCYSGNMHNVMKADMIQYCVDQFLAELKEQALGVTA